MREGHSSRWHEPSIRRSSREKFDGSSIVMVSRSSAGLAGRDLQLLCTFRLRPAGCLDSSRNTLTMSRCSRFVSLPMVAALTNGRERTVQILSRAHLSPIRRA
jgi:hypothetical protein